MSRGAGCFFECWVGNIIFMCLMENKIKFTIYRLLSDFGVVYPGTVDLGFVSILRLRDEDVEIKNVLEVSLKSHQETSMLNIAMMMRYEAMATDLQEAACQADAVFNNVLDILDVICNYGVSRIALLNSGFYLSDSSQLPQPLKSKSNQLPFPSFSRARPENDPNLKLCRALLSPTNINCELHNRFINSAHWSRNARWEINPQLKLLFKWFSMEALLVVNKKDEIIPYVKWALGFPSGQNAKKINAVLIISDFRSTPKPIISD